MLTNHELDIISKNSTFKIKYSPIFKGPLKGMEIDLAEMAKEIIKLRNEKKATNLLIELKGKVFQLRENPTEITWGEKNQDTRRHAFNRIIGIINRMIKENA